MFYNPHRQVFYQENFPENTKTADDAFDELEKAWLAPPVANGTAQSSIEDHAGREETSSTLLIPMTRKGYAISSKKATLDANRTLDGNEITNGNITSNGMEISNRNTITSGYAIMKWLATPNGHATSNGNITSLEKATSDGMETLDGAATSSGKATPNGNLHTATEEPLVMESGRLDEDSEFYIEISCDEKMVWLTSQNWSCLFIMVLLIGGE